MTHTYPLLKGRLYTDAAYMRESVAVHRDAVIVFNIYKDGISEPRPIFVGEHRTWKRSKERILRKTEGVAYRIVVYINKKG
jgi:hypothetical protein